MPIVGAFKNTVKLLRRAVLVGVLLPKLDHPPKKDNMRHVDGVSTGLACRIVS
jgi:hypothetical protein